MEEDLFQPEPLQYDKYGFVFRDSNQNGTSFVHYGNSMHMRESDVNSLDSASDGLSSVYGYVYCTKHMYIDQAIFQTMLVH